jgi:uncharacterized Ntn-hydrolase superfamily protein
MKYHLRVLVQSFLMAFLMLFSTLSASATWSIVAVDPSTGEVGSAGASHTPAVWPILGIVGGKGVIVAQALGNEAARLLAVSMLQEEADPVAIMGLITNKEFSSTVADQQFGLATLYGGSVGFTGSACAPWAGHAGDDFVMVQGNILASDHVVSDALAAFHASRLAGSPLADSLVAALLAGSIAGGDSRASGTDSAMTAYVAVAQRADPPGKPSFALIVPPQGTGVNPVKILSERFQASKGKNHPLFFPSFTLILLLLVGIPLVASAITGLILRAKSGGRKFGPHTWIELGISALVPVAAFFALAGLSLLASWAMPIYGSYTWMVPVALVVLSIPVFGLIRGLYWLIAKIGLRVQRTGS